MNGLLLDTHIFLWYVTNDIRLSSEITRQIDEATLVQLSIASTWEISIKVGLGKVKLDRPLSDLVGSILFDKNIDILPISESDVLAYANLSFPNAQHRDPFDRMLVVQAAERGLTLLTSNAVLESYGIFVTVV